MGADRHQSWFEYNISKPYPFRWFTPVTVIGFLLFATIFSFINYIADGFILVNIVTQDPNTTIADNHWFQSWPSLLTSKSASTCQPLSIPVNSMLSTNQTGLHYTLTDVWQSSSTSVGGIITRPSLPYFNNVIEDCTISSVELDLAATERGANQIAYAEWGVVVRSYATCSTTTAIGLVMFNLTQEYDYVPSALSMSYLDGFLGTNFISRDNQTRASLWWGESLLSTYWASLCWQMQVIRETTTANGDPAIRKGTLSFAPISTSSNDIMDLDYFYADYRLIIETMAPPGAFNIITPVIPTGVKPGSAHRVSWLSDNRVYPNVWTLADRLAKSAYSTILADLGQANKRPNILVNPATLQNYTLDFGHTEKANAWPGPATASYATLKGITGPLDISASVFQANYLCQIPQRKAGGSLFISVLSADLVFLHSVWIIFNLVVRSIHLRHQPEENSCDGHSAKAASPQPSAEVGRYRLRRLPSDSEEMELLPVQNATVR